MEIYSHFLDVLNLRVRPFSFIYFFKCNMTSTLYSLDTNFIMLKYNPSHNYLEVCLQFRGIVFISFLEQFQNCFMYLRLVYNS